MKPRTEPLKPVERLQDLGTSKWILFDHRTGASRPCNERGEPIPKFYAGFSGFVNVAQRKERNLMPKVDFTADLPYMGLPQKYTGYGHVPRPGLNMSATAECAYLLPKHLYPPKAVLGRVSTRAKVVAKKAPIWPEGKPTYVDTLGSNYAPTLSLKRFNDEQATMQTQADLAAKTARNRQKIEDDGSERLAQLREQRTVTKGRFFATQPPFNPSEIRDQEEVKDRKVNPVKWKNSDSAYLLDKKSVDKRRRDRYLLFFVEKEEQERQMRELQEMTDNTASMVETQEPKAEGAAEE